jgi:hypothetical protein
VDGSFLTFWDLLLPEWVNNYEQTASSHASTTPFSIHPAFIYFLQPVRAAGMPYVCSFLKRSTMPAALTLTHVLFGVFGG